MERVALNEQLREEFACVVKHFCQIRRQKVAHLAAADAALVAVVAAKDTLPAPGGANADATPTTATASDAATAAPAPAELAEPLVALDAYLQRATAILQRVNTYQYHSRGEFHADLVALAPLAPSSDQRLMLQHLIDQQQALVAEGATTRRRGTKIHGLRVDRTGIPGLQRLAEDDWLCNLDVHGATATVARYRSRGAAVAGYEQLQRDIVASKRGMLNVHDLARRCVREQRLRDTSILREAMKLCKPCIPTQRFHDLASLVQQQQPQPTQQPAAAPSPQAQPSPAPPSSPIPNTETYASVNGGGSSNGRREPRSRVKDTPSESRRRDSTARTRPPRPPAVVVPSPSAAGSGPDSQTPMSRMTKLRLRRLLQMRFCKHIDGQKICARLNEPGIEESWEATGRLDKNRVICLRTRKAMDFSDFVLQELSKSVAACAHLFLVKTHESIDDHLMTCEEMDEEIRALVEHNFVKASLLYSQRRR